MLLHILYDLFSEYCSNERWYWLSDRRCWCRNDREGECFDGPAYVTRVLIGLTNVVSECFLDLMNKSVERAPTRSKICPFSSSVAPSNRCCEMVGVIFRRPLRPPLLVPRPPWHPGPVPHPVLVGGGPGSMLLGLVCNTITFS